MRIAVLIFVTIFAISSIESSWLGFGLGLGLFSAALGWALQRPNYRHCCMDYGNY